MTTIHTEPTTTAPATTQTSEPATEKQAAFIRRLLDERVLPPLNIHLAGPSESISGEDRKATALAKLEAGEFTKRQASKTIEWLITLERI